MAENGISSCSIGDTVVLDVAVFHRSGVSGACHIEEGIEYVIMNKTDDGRIVLYLTLEQEENLYSGYVSPLYSIVVPEDEPTSHETVVSVREA